MIAVVRRSPIPFIYWSRIEINESAPSGTIRTTRFAMTMALIGSCIFEEINSNIKQSMQETYHRKYDSVSSNENRLFFIRIRLSIQSSQISETKHIYCFEALFVISTKTKSTVIIWEISTDWLSNVRIRFVRTVSSRLGAPN